MSVRVLIPLEIWDKVRMQQAFDSKTRPIAPVMKNSIACPECGKELVDSSPELVLTSYPGQKEVKCLGCGYTGTRIE